MIDSMNHTPTANEIFDRIYSRKQGGDYSVPEINEYKLHVVYLDCAEMAGSEVDSREVMLGKMKRSVASASKSAYVAWTWLAGDAALSHEIDEMDNRKDALRVICDYYGWVS